MSIIIRNIAIALSLAGIFSSCKSEEKCPVRVYTKQEHRPTDEQLRQHKPYIDLINSMGTFWIEFVEDASLTDNAIRIGCTQLFNNLLLIDTRILFIFFTGELAERAKDGELSDVTEKDGFYFRSSYIFPADVPLPDVPKVTPQEAIERALRREPLEEFCQYELCYWTRSERETPRLTWKLSGKRHWAYIDAITGEILSWLPIGFGPPQI